VALSLWLLRRLGKRTTDDNASAWGGLRRLCRTKRSSTSEPGVGKLPAIGKGTTETGHRNRNRQVVIRVTRLPGADHYQYVYVLRCGNCEYGTNGSGIFERLCPYHQGGTPGSPSNRFKLKFCRLRGASRGGMNRATRVRLVVGMVWVRIYAATPQ
jgi:hypothetical protein